ncbi:putative acid proteinase [Podospora australis]|uniref:Acid proteinase n=1 Tax=Podospora australis TaxID=1536484 RepID=A0AAN6X423_9PEZI|nr:putative acid proteinase [Podospora australis]
MKSTTLLGALSLVASTLAATIPAPPSLPLKREPHQLRLLHTAPISPSPPPGAARVFSVAVEAAAEESVKGGAVIKNPGVSVVQATFRVPLAQQPMTGPTAGNPVGLYAASFHVGIDSFSGTCANFFRAGVDIFWDGTLGGEQSPFAWYQFGGVTETVGFSNFTVRAGEVVRITVQDSLGSGNSTEATATIENFGQQLLNGTSGTSTAICVKGLTPKQASTQKISKPSGEGSSLCKGEAGFVVEDFPLAGMPQFPVALANFTTVAFKDVGITVGSQTGGGEKKNAKGAELKDIRLAPQGGRLTACALVGGGKGVKCDRVVGE